MLSTAPSESTNTSNSSTNIFSSIHKAVSSLASKPTSRKPTPTPTPTRTTHERSIPSIATRACAAQALDVHTSLSFCLPTSLAFFKRLTWEQTPWIPHFSTTTPANPISRRDASTISTYLHKYCDAIVPIDAVHNALLFGSAYPISTSNAPMGSYPHLFVVFPNVTTRLATNETFLRIWHDQIVKPAFDRAWRDSGIAPTYGAELDGLTRILPASGVRTANDALPWSGFLTRLRKGSRKEVRTYWPLWTDDWGRGHEGQFSDVRAKVMHEAWKAMLGMIEGHPNLSNCQNPILLAICREDVHYSSHLSPRAIYKNVGEAWDKSVDARYVVPNSFQVVLETVVAAKKEEQVVEKPRPWVANAQGQFKRMVEDEEGGEEDGNADAHRNKRKKRGKSGIYRGRMR